MVHWIIKNAQVITVTLIAKGSDLEASRYSKLLALVATLCRIFDNDWILEEKLKILFLINNPSNFKALKNLKKCFAAPQEHLVDKRSLQEKFRKGEKLSEE